MRYKCIVTTINNITSGKNTYKNQFKTLLPLLPINLLEKIKTNKISKWIWKPSNILEKKALRFLIDFNSICHRPQIPCFRSHHHQIRIQTVDLQTYIIVSLKYSKIVWFLELYHVYTLEGKLLM